MKSDLQERAELVGMYINSTHSTIRETASLFGVSKSTVHLDVSKRLKKINPILYKKVNKILKQNFDEKHLRGGEATKSKYLKIKK